MSQNTPIHVYETVIKSTPEQVWQALTDPELTQKYYFNCRVESDWQKGSACRYYGARGTVDLDGTILEIEPQHLLVTTFEPKWVPDTGASPSKLTWEIQPLRGVSLVRLTHTDIDDTSFEAGRMHLGWVYSLSSLKSLLETGKSLPNMFG
jgi:Uncharacterized conserved protein